MRGQASSGNWFRFVVVAADGGLGVAVKNDVGDASSHVVVEKSRLASKTPSYRLRFVK